MDRCCGGVVEGWDFEIGMVRFICVYFCCVLDGS